MRIIPALFLCACATAWAPSALASESAASRAAAPEVLRTWVDARAGTGAPVFWLAEGGVYAYPSGKKLLGMIGFDASTVIWPEEPGGEVTHLTRKTFTYTDPVSGEILTEYNGQAVEPVAYPYQLITYRMRDGRIYGAVEQGVGDRVQRIESRNGMQVRKLGQGTTAVTAAVFLDFPIPGGSRYQAWENYDFFIHSAEDVDEPHQLTWQRYGALPSFAGQGNAIYHLLSWRVESHEEFPPTLLEWARREAPMWLRPPADLDEIRALQAGAAVPRGRLEEIGLKPRGSRAYLLADGQSVHFDITTAELEFEGEIVGGTIVYGATARRSPEGHRRGPETPLSRAGGEFVGVLGFEAGAVGGGQ